jgi:hypothetical protein
MIQLRHRARPGGAPGGPSGEPEMNRRMDASPQLDAVVAEQFLGGRDGAAWFDAPPAFSSDAGAAFRLMASERWPPGWALRKRAVGPAWQVLDLEAAFEVVAEAPTAALAICRAALASLEWRAAPRVIRQPLSTPRRPLPDDLAWIYRNLPACYRIQRWLNPSGRHWWRGSFGPAADLETLSRRLRAAGFPDVHPVAGGTPTDLWLRRCTESEANAAE